LPRALRRTAAAAVVPASALALLLLGSAACGPREPLPAPEAYERFCARCHGDDGRGDPKAVRLNPRLDLVASEMVRAGDRELVRERIAEGKGAMPGLERKLVPGELEALTEYTIERFGTDGR
jgi:cytochrome c5